MSSAMEIFERFVAFDTVSSNACRATIDWVAGLLRSHSVTVEGLPGNHAGTANLLARIGPVRKGGVVLSGWLQLSSVRS